MEKIDTIVVSASSVLKALKGNESAFEKTVADRARELDDDWQQAALMAQFGEALRELEAEERKTSPRVLHSPQNALASRLQSALAEQSLDLSPLAEGGNELKFDEVTDPLGWFWSVVRDWNGNQHPIVRPLDPAPAAVGDSFKIALFSDWATGMYGAPHLRDSIQNMPGELDLVMHLGDTYYAGSEKEVRQRLLAFLPKRADAVRRTLNGNHEMYSGGWAYFDIALAELKQKSSYFALKNSNWLLIALDTAHTDFDIDSDQATWLKETIDKHGAGKKVMLFSHHQIFSQLDHQGPKLAKSIGSLLIGKKIDYWYWGHEHRCVLYDRHDGYNLVARCVGHGGMPQTRGPEQVAPAEDSIANVTWRRLGKKVGVPSALILDGPNDYIPGQEKGYSPHGFLTVSLSGKQAQETYYLPDRTPIWDRPLP
jgi:hypothetical protein